MTGLDLCKTCNGTGYTAESCNSCGSVNDVIVTPIGSVAKLTAICQTCLDAVEKRTAEYWRDLDICPDCNGTGERLCDKTQCQRCHGYGRFSLAGEAFQERMRRNAEWCASQPWRWRLRRYLWRATYPARERIRELLR